MDAKTNGWKFEEQKKNKEEQKDNYIVNISPCGIHYKEKNGNLMEKFGRHYLNQLLKVSITIIDKSWASWCNSLRT